MTLKRFSSGDRQIREFVEIGRLPYLDDMWRIPSLSGLERRRLSPRHPSMDYTEVLHITAWEGRTPLGRILAFSNSKAVNGRGAVGYIGMFECVESKEAAKALIDASVDHLIGRGCRTILAPVDGSTWYRYRFVTAGALEAATEDAHARRPFAGEPHNPRWYPDAFATARFEPVQRYRSSLIREIDPFVNESRQIVHRYLECGYRFRAYRRSDEELLHELIRRIFGGNLAFTDCGKREFRSAVASSLALLPKGYVRFALSPSGTPIGFIVTMPDFGDRLRRIARGGSVGSARFAVGSLHRRKTDTDRLIIRTLGVLPGLRRVAAGRALLATAYAQAITNGFTKIIHAHMVTGSEMITVNEHNADASFREYTLFGRTV